MTTAIQVSKVSKKYLISHEILGASFKETLTKLGKDWILKLLHPFKAKRPPSKIVEEFWALKNICLEIEEGDQIGIIGQNGAGKSTLLKILSRITEPTHGQIKIKGRISSLLELGTGFHPDLTGRENIFLNGAILGMKNREIKQKFEQIVDFAGIEMFLDTPVKYFSSGMYTRLGFSIAVHRDPDVLIIDEVLAVGDLSFQEKCLKKLDDLRANGRTILFVGHDLGRMTAICNKGVYLEKGEIKHLGSMETCLNAYMKYFPIHSLSWKGNVGDEAIRFNSVRLHTCESHRDFFYQGEQTKLEIEYEVIKPCRGLMIDIGIYDQRYQKLACSQINGDNPAFFNTSGKHSLSFILDAGLFHEGEYLLKLNCMLSDQKHISKDEIILQYHVRNPKEKVLILPTTKRQGVCLGNHWQYLSN